MEPQFFKLKLRSFLGRREKIPKTATIGETFIFLRFYKLSITKYHSNSLHVHFKRVKLVSYVKGNCDDIVTANRTLGVMHFQLIEAQYELFCEIIIFHQFCGHLWLSKTIIRHVIIFLHDCLNHSVVAKQYRNLRKLLLDLR